MIDIALIGPTRVSCRGTTLVARHLGGSKPRQVLEILAVELGRPVSKDALAERLWEDTPPRSYIATIESYVCGLRRRLADLSSEEGVLVTSTGGYLLDGNQVRVDLVEARRALAERDGAQLRRAVELPLDDLLADDPCASWSNGVREQVLDERLQACLDAAHTANAQGDDALAEQFARAAVHGQAWSEPAVQELMAALAHSGKHAQALLEYQSLRTAMREELGVEPSPATQSLYMSILCAESQRPSHDLSVLLTLLKDALESAVSTDRRTVPAMAEVGRMLLARA